MAEGGGGGISSREARPRELLWGLSPPYRDVFGETGAWYLSLEVSKGLRAALQGSVSCWPSLLLFGWALVRVVVPEKETGKEGEETDAESGG